MILRKTYLLLLVILFVLSISASAQTNDELEFQLFRDEVSLTVYVPEGQSGSLANVAFMVSSTGYALDDPILLAFGGFDFSQIQGPICFRLEKAGSTVPPPIDCSSLDPSYQLTQQLPAANIYWFRSNQGLLINAMRGTEELGRCPGTQSSCTMRVPQNILFDGFNGTMLKSHWNADDFPADFYQVEDGHLHITATNNTEQWKQWEMHLDLGGSYATAEADFELVNTQGGEAFLGIGGTTLDNQGCFAVGLWANNTRFPDEQRGYSEVGAISSGDSSCQNIESTIYTNFEWTSPTLLSVDLSSSALQLSKNGSPVKSAELSTGSTFVIRIQLDAGASLEGYVDNVSVKYTGIVIDEDIDPPIETPTESNSFIVRCFDQDASCPELKPPLANGRLSDALIEYSEEGDSRHVKISSCGNTTGVACGWWTWLENGYDYTNCEALTFDAYADDSSTPVRLLIEFKLGPLKIFEPEITLGDNTTWAKYQIDLDLNDTKIDTITFIVQANPSFSPLHIDNIQFENCSFLD